MTVASNAGPIISLSWIDRLDLLEVLFEEVLVPVAVQEEVLRPAPEALGMAAIQAAFAAGWLRARAVQDQGAVVMLTAVLDRGEAEAIILAEETGIGVLLLDERMAWSEAQRRGLFVMGTIGVLQRARERGLIPAVHPVVLELQRLGFWISTTMLDQIRRYDQEHGR